MFNGTPIQQKARGAKCVISKLKVKEDALLSGLVGDPSMIINAKITSRALVHREISLKRAKNDK